MSRIVLLIFIFCLLAFVQPVFALETVTSNPPVITKVGDPAVVKPGTSPSPSPSPSPSGSASTTLTPGGPLEQFALSFVSEVKRVCNGAISSSNQGCIDSINPGLSSSRKGWVNQSVRDGAGFYQCVGLVQTVIDAQLSVLRAFQLINNPQLGYHYQANNGAAKTKPGDIVVWAQSTKRGDGHTAPDRRDNSCVAGHRVRETGEKSNTGV